MAFAALSFACFSLVFGTKPEKAEKPSKPSSGDSSHSSTWSSSRKPDGERRGEFLGRGRSGEGDEASKGRSTSSARGDSRSDEPSIKWKKTSLSAEDAEKLAAGLQKDKDAKKFAKEFPQESARVIAQKAKDEASDRKLQAEAKLAAAQKSLEDSSPEASKKIKAEIERHKQTISDAADQIKQAEKVLPKPAKAAPVAAAPTPNPYEVLGLAPNASDAEIKKAYFKMARDTHPDKHTDDPLAKEKFQAIGAAYNALKPENRHLADADLAAASKAAPDKAPEKGKTSSAPSAAQTKAEPGAIVPAETAALTPFKEPKEGNKDWSTKKKVGAAVLGTAAVGGIGAAALGAGAVIAGGIGAAALASKGGEESKAPPAGDALPTDAGATGASGEAAPVTDTFVAAPAE